MMYLHLLSISVLGLAVLWGLRLIYSRPTTAGDDALLLICTIGAWVLVFLGLAFVAAPPVWVAGLVIAAMVVAQYRDSERRALLWTLAVAAEKGLSLATAARSFAVGRIDEIGRRATKLADLLDAGLPLPQALNRSRNPLPKDAALAANLGYATGSLAGTLRHAAREGDRIQSVTHSYYAGLMYFVLVSNLMLVILLFVCIQVMPTWETILRDFDLQLPFITQFALGLAQWIARYSLLWTPVLLLANAALVYAVLGYMGVRLPEFGLLDRWLGSRDTPIILRSLAHSVAQGRPLTEGLELLGQWYPTMHVAQRLLRATEQVRGGQHWCDSLEQQRLLRPAEAAVLKSAERVNNLQWALAEMADMSTRRARAARRVTCEPVFATHRARPGRADHVVHRGCHCPPREIGSGTGCMKRQRHRRSGFAMVELLVAAAVVAMLIALVAEGLSAVAQQLRRNREQLAAIEAASSIMELVTALPDPALGPNALEQPEIQAIIQQTLDRWDVALRISDVEEDIAGQRIELSLSRRQATGDRRPLKLTAWKFRHKETSP